MPSISSSPWAKLITRMTPKMIVRPIPISAYTPPIRMPLIRDWRKISIRRTEKARTGLQPYASGYFLNPGNG